MEQPMRLWRVNDLQRVERDFCGIRTLTVVAGLEVAPKSEYWGAERMWRTAVDADRELLVAVGDHVAEPRTLRNVADRGPGFAATGCTLLDACHQIAARGVKQLDQRANRYGRVQVELADDRGAGGLRDG